MRSLCIVAKGTGRAPTIPPVEPAAWPALIEPRLQTKNVFQLMEAECSGTTNISGWLSLMMQH